MRNRWFESPRLHDPSAGATKRVTWLELFYDLIFVAAFIQLGNGLSRHVSVAGFLGFAAVFVPMWVAWTGFTFYLNRFAIDDFAHRLLVFVQMVAIGAMAVTAPLVLDGQHRAFALAFAAAQAIIASQYIRAWRQVAASRAYSAYWGSVFGIGALLWALSSLVSPPYAYGLWALGLIEVIAAPFRRRSRELTDRYPWDHEHLAERYGLLTLVVLGESFVKVLTSLEESDSIVGIAVASFTLLITCCLWWIYFDDVAGSTIKRRRLAPVIWLYAHLPMQLAMVAVGVAIKKMIGLEIFAPAPAGYRWFLSAALALALFSVALLDSVTERRQAELSDRARVHARWFSAVLILLLAPSGAGMSAAVYLALVTAVCVAQVIFDLISAPLAEEMDEPASESLGDLVRRRGRGREGEPLPRVAPGDALRKGAPSEMRSDFYFHFMEGSWAAFLGTLLALYALLNVLFASLFFLRRGSIAGVGGDSFGDAFFFSVETFSTIGFGAMHPTSAYGHTIVTAEAATAMIFAAVAAGLTFAKVSRPRSSVLFSKVAVITVLDGKPTLIFRVGNARGNDVVSAEISVTALIDEVSAEGQHLRRLHDLELKRSFSPVFTLSWAVMHVIDEASPLAVGPTSFAETLSSLIVVLKGHDGTYGQTIYARHSYYAEDIREGERFVDVIHTLPDGRMLVDFSLFHETLSEDGPPPSSEA